MNNYTILLLAAGIIAIILAFVVYRRGAVPGGRYFTLLMLSLSIWSAAYGMELNSPDLRGITFWVRIEYIGILSLPVFWLAFALQYTGRDHWLSKRNICLLMLEPAAALILFWTNNVHELFWQNVSLINHDGITLAVFSHGLGFWLNAAYAYLLLLIGTLVIIHSMLGSRNLHRGQILSLMVGVLVPWCINAFYLLGISPFPFIDPTPFAFTISGIAISWGLLRYRLMEIVPLAQAALVANMPDGVIVLDAYERILDINKAAEDIFNRSAASVFGWKAERLFKGQEDVIQRLKEESYASAEFTLGEKQDRRYYDLRSSVLNEYPDPLSGRVIVLRDVTERMEFAKILDRREAILDAVRFAALKFLTSPSQEENIPLVLERLGEAVQASRVYIFENFINEEGVRMMRQSYEWLAPGIASHFKTPNSQTFTLQQGGLGRWEELLNQHQPVYGLVREFPKIEQRVLDNRQILSLAIVPIYVGDFWWGFIGFDECAYQRQWSKSEIDALEAAAATLGFHIQRRQLDLKQHQRATELTMLHDVSLEITSENELPTLLETIVDRAMTLLGGTGGGLYLCDHEKQEVRCVTNINTAEDFTGTVLKFGEGAAGIVAQTGSPLIIDDYRTWDGRANIYEKDRPFRSVVSAPLIWQGKVTGIIHVLHHLETRRFTGDDLTLLTLFANQAAIALHNAQLFDATQQRAQRMTLLNEITRTSLEIENLQQMLDHFAVKLAELLGASGCYISLWDDAHECPLQRAACGSLSSNNTDDALNPLILDLIKSAIQAGKVLTLEDDSRLLPPKDSTSRRITADALLALPLITGEHKMGAALLAFDQTQTFIQDEIVFGELAASQIALAAAKIRLLEKERRRADELDALRAIVSDISTHLELSNLLQTILERAASLLDATGGDLGLYDEEKKEILIVVSHKMGKDYKGTRMALGEGAMGRAVELNKPVVVTNYHQWEGRSPQYGQGPWHGVLAVPLDIRGRPVGALGIVDANPLRLFTPEDQRLLNLFAQQAAIAIENGHLYTDEKKRAVELEILFQSSAAMTNSLDLPKVYSIATQQLAKAVDATSAYILSCDLINGRATVLTEYFGPDANALELVSDLGVTYDLNKSPRTLEALRARKPITTMISDRDIDINDLEEMLNYGTKSVIKLPMIVAGQLMGYAEIWDSRTEKKWSDEELRLCQTLANQAAVAIENARLYEEMQMLAVTDSLTGVYNRRGFFEAAQRELTRAYRYHRPLSAILMDIDHFKQVNDVYSHAIGDEVLQTLAQRCRYQLRDVDILGRYGGEEFVILLPETDCESASRIAERLRHKLTAEPILTEYGSIEITLSMGVACTTEEIEALAILIDRADTAMYDAKNGGRNQVAVSQVVKVS